MRGAAAAAAAVAAAAAAAAPKAATGPLANADGDRDPPVVVVPAVHPDDAAAAGAAGRAPRMPGTSVEKGS